MFKVEKQTSKPATSESTEWNSFGRGILLAVGHSINFSLLLEDADEVQLSLYIADSKASSFGSVLRLYLFSKAIAPTRAGIAVPCAPNLTCLAGLLDCCTLGLELLKLKNSYSSVNCYGQQRLWRVAGVTGITAFPEFSYIFCL